MLLAALAPDMAGILMRVLKACPRPALAMV